MVLVSWELDPFSQPRTDAGRKVALFLSLLFRWAFDGNFL